MRLTPDIEHQLIGEIYDAALQPALWEPLFNRICLIFQAKYTNMLITDELNPSYNIVLSHGKLQEMNQWDPQKNFSSAHRNIIKTWIDHGLQTGEMRANHQLFGGIENYKQAAGAYYTEVLEPSGSLWMMGATLENTDFRCSLLSLHRGPEQPAFSNMAQAQGQRLVPHFRRALQIHRQLSLVNQENERLYTMLDRMVAGILLVDANGRVCYANPAAENLLSRNNALSVSARYGLKTADMAEWQALKTLLGGAIRTGLRERHRLSLDDTPAGGVIGIGGQAGKVPLMLTIAPLSEMSGYEDLANDGIAASIFLSDPASERKLATHLLKSTFLLNERECDVCEAFLNNATIEGIADTLGISIHTVRGYLKVIYEKTGHRSQAELMKLLMGMTLDFEHIL